MLNKSYLKKKKNTVPLYTVQYTQCLYTVQYTQCLSIQCSTHSASLYSVVHTVPLYIVQYTQCLSIQCSRHSAGLERTTHSLQVYTDGSKDVDIVGSRIAVFAWTNLITTQIYRLNGRCSNNQAEQFAILKTLECIQNRCGAVVSSECIPTQRNHTTHIY